MENENKIEEQSIEKKNDNKNIIIIILIVIILLLVTIITLILTGVINFNGSNQSNIITNTMADNNNFDTETVLKKVVIITGDGVRVRDSANTSGSKVLGSVSKNQEFDLLDENMGSSGNGCSKEWYKIDYKGNVGYVCGEYAKIDNESIHDCKKMVNVNYIDDSEAKGIIENLFSSKTISTIENKINNETYCDWDKDSFITRKIPGYPDGEYDQDYYKCEKYNTFNELQDAFRKNITNNYLKYISLDKMYVLVNGEKIYHFYEENNSLYMIVIGRGAVGYSYDELFKNKYNIISHSNDTITANLVLYRTVNIEDVSLKEVSNAYIKLKKENDTWKIDEYYDYCEE